MSQRQGERPRAEWYAGGGPAQFAEMVAQAQRSVARWGIHEVVHAHRHDEECTGSCTRIGS